MRTLIYKYFAVLIACLILLPVSLLAQNRNATFKNRSEYTTAFQINENEVQKLLANKLKGSELTQLLHTPVVSFTQKWEDAPVGHYVYANVIGDNIILQYVGVAPFQIFLFKEYGKLTLQIVDNEGKVRDDASVVLEGRWKLLNERVPYDKNNKTYSTDVTSDKEKRILTVKLDGFKMTYDLAKHVVKPIEDFNNSRSDYSDDESKGDGTNFYSYMITDKNKYKPGENVRFKSYALGKNKKALNSPLSVWLRTTGDDKDYKQIKTITPYNKGGYADEVALHDSLNLKLDMTYPLQLRDKEGRIVAHTSFKYEDYDLLQKYELHLELADKHFYPNTNSLTVNLTDQNGLPVLGSKVSISLHKEKITATYEPVFRLKDMPLIASNANMLTNGKPTVFDLRAELLGEADMYYTVNVTVAEPNGREFKRYQRVMYQRNTDDVKCSLAKDSLVFEYYNRGNLEPAKAELSYGNQKAKKIVELPYKELYSQYDNKYTVRLLEGDFEKTISQEAINTGIDLMGELRSDQFEVELINPSNIECSWYIYEGSMLLETGAGTELKFDKKYPETGTTHFVELFYVLGGTNRTFRKSFVSQDDKLHVEMDMPERVFPGQTVDATITVRDNWRRPQKNVDLTAFSVTSLLDYQVPELPYYGTIKSMGREQRSSYSVNTKHLNLSVPLDYASLGKLLRLDEQDYYKLRYPKGVLYEGQISIGRMKTEVAPYVFRNGQAVVVDVIEINDVPVFFSWTDNDSHSFEVADSLEQNITLHLRDRVLKLPPMRFEKGKKTILGLDIDALPANVTEQKRENTSLQTLEGEYLKKYEYQTVQFDYPLDSRRIEVLEMKGGKSIDFYFLNRRYNYNYNRNRSVVLGPIVEGDAKFMGHDFVLQGRNIYDFKNANFTKSSKSNITYKIYGVPTSRRLEISELYQSNEMAWYNDDEFGVAEFYLPQITLGQDGSLRMDMLQGEDKKVLDMTFKKVAGGKITKVMLSNSINQNNISNNELILSEPLLGIYDLTVAYSDGYQKIENVNINPEIPTIINLRIVDMKPKDEVWQALINSKSQFAIDYSASQRYTPDFGDGNNSQTTTMYTFSGSNSNIPHSQSIRGVVRDEYGEGLVGVTVHIKGNPTIGTVADIDGNFVLYMPRPIETLIISCIGFKNKEVKVYRGTQVDIVLEESQQLLEEVVVVAYGVQKRSMMMGSVSTISDYNAPETGLPQEDVEDSDAPQQGNADEDKLYKELMQLNGLRSNFSDVGFWQPALFTDGKGQAKFSVTFPGDITRWDAMVYAMNDKLKTGTLRQFIRSYKPLMGELRTPNFMVVGDSAKFVGSIRNYTKDATLEGNLTIVQDADTLTNETISMDSYRMDKPLMVAQDTDSLTASYIFKRNDGYSDGEQRTIPIIQQGIELKKGDVKLLNFDQEMTVEAGDDESVEVRVMSNQLDVFMEATYYLTGYAYACNEQLSSKLIGLLNYKIYREYKQLPFEYDKNVKEILQRLKNNQNSRGLWSWWHKEPEVAHWMTAQVVRALGMAHAEGYNISIDLKKIQNAYFGKKIDEDISITEKMDVLQAIAQWGKSEDQVKLVDQLLAEEPDMGTLRKLQLMEVQQLNGKKIEADSLKALLQTDANGAMHVKGGGHGWRESDLLSTLPVYRMAKRTAGMENETSAMLAYFLLEMKDSHNTYESAAIVSSVLKDLTKINQAEALLTITRSDGRPEDIKVALHTFHLASGERATLHSKSKMPVIVATSSSTNIRRTEAHSTGKFTVKTTFPKNMRVEESIYMHVEVTVTEEQGEYVIIEAPIPAGCIYDPSERENTRTNRNEVHREHFKDKVAIFCTRLPVGTHTFSVYLLPQFEGVYNVNSTKVEQMYQPAINANSDMQKVKIGGVRE